MTVAPLAWGGVRKASPGAWGPEATSGESARGAEPLSHKAQGEGTLAGTNRL
jgi:hypothetical protein